MRFSFSRVASWRSLALTWMLLVATQAWATNDWENGDTVYHNVCSGCHDPSPAVENTVRVNFLSIGGNATSLQNKINTGASGTQMGAPDTTQFRTGGSINSALSDVAAYIANQNYPRATLTTTNANFGSVGVGFTPFPTRTFTVKNDGFGPLSINNAYVYNTGNGTVDNTNFSVSWVACATVSNTGTNTCDIVVTFKPQSAVTFANRELRVETNALNSLRTSALLPSPVGLVPFAFTGPATLTFSPTLTPTGILQVGFTNNLGDGVTVCRTDTPTPPAAPSPLSAPAEFTVTGRTFDGSGCFNMTTSAQVPVSLSVKYSQIAGPHNAELSIYRTANAASKFKVDLVGNPGPVAKIDKSSLFEVPPNLTVDIDNDHTLTLPILLESRGSVDLDLSAANTFTIINDPNHQYQLSGTGCEALPAPRKLAKFDASPAPSCQLSVTFNPSDVGVQPARLVIHIPNVSPDLTVDLLGQGYRGARLVVQQGGMPVTAGSLFEFGTQTKGGLYPTKRLTLSNGGTQGNLLLTLPAAGSVPGFSFVASAGCASLPPPPPYAPAAPACTIDIKFDAAAVQEYTSPLVIQSNPEGSATQTSFQLNLHGIATTAEVPVLSWRDPVGGQEISQIAFPDTDTGAPTTSTIRLYNAGKGGVLLGIANLVGIDASNFTLDISDCTAKGTLYDTQSCEVIVKFAPGSAGTKTASVQYTASGSTPLSLVVPPLLVATGKAFGTSSATLKVSATSMHLADTTVGAASLPQELTLSNTGTQSMRILSLTATAPFAVQAKTCASAPFDLAAGTECTINVSVAPQSEGNLTGTLTVTSDGSPAAQDIVLSVSAEPKANVSSGGGCSISDGQSLVDPALWTMVLLAIGVLFARRRRGR